MSRPRTDGATRVPDLESEQKQGQRAALWNLRQHLGWKQVQLAEHLGMGLRSITRWEREGDVIPLAVVRKLMDLVAAQPGMEADFRWWDMYLQNVLRTKTGLDATEAVILRGHQPDTRPTDVLHTVLELWGVFQPQMNPAEERIHSRISGLLNELTDELMPQQEIRCPKCGQSDRTHRFVMHDKGKPIDMYSCDRCQEGGKVEKGKKD